MPDRKGIDRSVAGLALGAAAIMGMWGTSQALAASLGSTLHGGSASPALIRVAELVPLPRPNPQRALEAVSSIEALISSAHEPSSSDMPPLAFVPPLPQPAPTQPHVISPTVPAQQASVTTVAPAFVATQRSVLSEAAFKVAVKLFDQNDVGAALRAADALPDPLDAKIIRWLVAVYKSNDVPSARIAAISHELAGWPGQSTLRLRYEQAVERENPGPQAVIQALGSAEPVSDDGLLLLARSYIAVGRKDAAAALLRPKWRDEKLSDDLENRIRKEFGSLLTKADYKVRMDRMLYAEQSTKALRAASALDANQQALAKAVVMVIKRDGKAGAALNALPKSLHKDPLHLYSRIQVLRRAEKIDAAADLMLSAPRDPSVLVDPDAWWVERRVVTRALIDQREYRKAYQVSAGFAGGSSVSRVEAAFHAGWLALEFLNDPQTARRHFAQIQSTSSMPLSQSRAEYWLGRAALKAGDRADAQRQFQRAAAYPTTFYGQLALASLGSKKLPLRFTPRADDTARARFDRLELVQVIKRLRSINRADREEMFMRYLGDTLTDPTQLALLAAMAERDGNHPLSLQIGKNAAARGLPVDNLAFPIGAIPDSARTGKVDKALVYAVARQESAFHPGAVSRAGAKGLLQLMPTTAKQVAKRAGVAYSESKLTSDPAYNVTLGAHYLGQRLGDFNGSYILTFAAYNAGKSRVDKWIQQFGDPRDPRVDAVTWIESIPFTETRNYVQRLMENVQVYRARLEGGALTIQADLKRGGR